MAAALSSLVVAALGLAFTGGADQAAAKPPAPLVLGVQGTSFTVDGAPRFLVFVSYFDALDAARLDEDLAWIAARADGIRVFPDWWDYDRARSCAQRFSDRTVMVTRRDGSIGVRPERLEKLKAVLDRAREAGLLVDLTFSYETVRGSSRLTPGADGEVCGSRNTLDNRVRLDAWSRGVGELAASLAGPAYRHVFFDLQNEWNGSWTRLTTAELSTLAVAVRRSDRKRLLTASSYDPRLERLVEAATSAGFDIATFHDAPRSAGWPRRVGGAVHRLSRALSAARRPLPVFAGEPPPETYGEGASAYRKALDAARQAGAAGWTFHTRASFRLDERGLPDLLDADGRAFLDSLAAGRNASGTTRPTRARRPSIPPHWE